MGSFAVIKKTVDGNYILAGAKANDFGLRKISAANGNSMWQKTMGGTQGDIAYHIQATTDGGYLVVGNTWSNDGDVSGLHGTGHADGWLVKLNKDVVSVGTLGANEAITISPNPTTGIINITGADNLSLQVYSTTGALLKKVEATNNISIAELPAGVYFLKLSNKDGDLSYTERIIKQ